MLKLITIIAIMYALIGIMYVTDNNRKKYTGYQIRQLLKKTAYANM